MPTITFNATFTSSSLVKLIVCLGLEDGSLALYSLQYDLTPFSNREHPIVKDVLGQTYLVQGERFTPTSNPNDNLANMLIDLLKRQFEAAKDYVPNIPVEAVNGEKSLSRNEFILLTQQMINQCSQSNVLHLRRSPDADEVQVTLFDLSTLGRTIPSNTPMTLRVHPSMVYDRITSYIESDMIIRGVKLVSDFFAQTTSVSRIGILSPR